MADRHFPVRPDLGRSVRDRRAREPLAGTTLLHLSVDNDEVEIARWLLARGAGVNAKAEVDAEGFGGHTALFGCVVRPGSTGRRCG